MNADANFNTDDYSIRANDTRAEMVKVYLSHCELLSKALDFHAALKLHANEATLAFTVMSYARTQARVIATDLGTWSKDAEAALQHAMVDSEHFATIDRSIDGIYGVLGRYHTGDADPNSLRMLCYLHDDVEVITRWLSDRGGANRSVEPMDSGAASVIIGSGDAEGSM